MTWDIFLGISALVAAFIPIGKIIVNNTKAMTSLEVTCKNLADHNKQQDHEIVDINTKLCDHEKKLGDHETRISVIESKE